MTEAHLNLSERILEATERASAEIKAIVLQLSPKYANELLWAVAREGDRGGKRVLNKAAGALAKEISQKLAELSAVASDHSQTETKEKPHD